jgi:hypothetical protein
MIVSNEHFFWFGSFCVTALAVVWFFYEIVRLVRFVPQGKKAHDEVFGSVIGFVISVIAIVGVLRFHLGG